MKAENLRIRYDRFADVLYISTEQNAPARSNEDDDGVLWRYAISDGHIVGATVMDYDAYWRSRKHELAVKVAQKFHVAEQAAERYLEENA